MKQGAPLQRRTALKRTGAIKPKPRRRPTVDWDVLREQVFRRDIEAIVRHYRHVWQLNELKATFTGRRLIIHLLAYDAEVCVARVLDEDAGECSGSWTLNHVEDPAQPMRGRKAPDDVDHLVSLCEYHHQGSLAGRVWASMKSSKLLQWDYLEERKREREETV